LEYGNQNLKTRIISTSG